MVSVSIVFSSLTVVVVLLGAWKNSVVVFVRARIRVRAWSSMRIYRYHGTLADYDTLLVTARVCSMVVVPPRYLLLLAVGLELVMTLVLVRIQVALLCSKVAWTVTVALTLLVKLKHLT